MVNAARVPSGAGVARPEIYVSTDVETDGPIPGPHSMLSFASAAYTAGKDLLATFSANLVPLAGACGDAATHHASGLVRRLPAQSCSAGRRDRAGCPVLRHARRQPAGPSRRVPTRGLDRRAAG